MQNFAVRVERQCQFFGHVHTAYRVLHQPLAASGWLRVRTKRFGRTRTCAANGPAQQFHCPGNQQNPKQKAQDPSQKTHGLEALTRLPLCSRFEEAQIGLLYHKTRAKGVYASRKAPVKRNCVVSIGCAADEPLCAKPPNAVRRELRYLVSVSYAADREPQRAAGMRSTPI